MKKVILILMLLMLPMVVAETEHGDSLRAEEILAQQISYDQLLDSDFEILGEYFMEQRHTGEQHEFMDNMMGGEGSEELRLAHINMGKNFYYNYLQYNLQNSGRDMMGSESITNYGYGMMGGGYNMMESGYMGLYGIVYLALGAFIFAAIFWLTYLWLVPKKKR